MTILQLRRVFLRHTKSTHQAGSVQNQKALTAYFSSKQLLPFGFADHVRCRICVDDPEINSGYSDGRWAAFLL